MYNICKKIGLRIIFVRYNPDEFKYNGIDTVVKKKDRLEILINCVGKMIDDPPLQQIVVAKLFYDCRCNNCNHIHSSEFSSEKELLNLVEK